MSTRDQRSAPEPAVRGIEDGPAAGAVRRGAKASAAILVFTQVVSFVQTLVLARLLAPAEVGLFAAGTVLSGLLVTLSEGGLRNALIQREHDVAVAAETVFWASLGSSVIWAAATAASAPLVSWIFEDPNAGLITLLTAGTIVMHALTYVPDALMQRRLDVRQRLVVPPTIALGFAVTAVVFAINGFGVWALVIGSYVQYTAWILASWSLAGWRPRRARFSRRVWRELSRFAFPLVLGAFVDKGRELAETALVGRQLSATALGHYRYGRKLATLPGVAVVEIFSYVLFPAFSRIAKDPVRFREVFLTALGLIWLVSCPLAGLLVVLGEPAVVVLLGEKWRGAGVAVVAMAGFGPGVAMCAVGAEAFKGYGRSQLMSWLTLSGVVVGLGLLVLLLPLGLVGVGLAISVDSLVSGMLALLLARKVVDVSLPDLARTLVPPVIATAVAMVAVGGLEHLFVPDGQHGLVLAISLLIGEAALFSGVFAVTMFGIAPARSVALIMAVKRFLRPGRADGAG
jgi:O-antigen/teichoic acid export membrane protein